MDVRLTWTDRDEAVDYVVPNVLSPRDLVSRPDNMDENCTTISLTLMTRQSKLKHCHRKPVNYIKLNS